ncbi:MAG: hypothetical protein CBE00_06555 [Planctomycetaceae bacterium TMED240]|nr:hypothetical protein [Rhodopirellula sp.]OUX06819.1 MAG: hypothetical protein CBE00_06555 [Planctomycetaceae bacterium TMED240]
MASVGGVSGGSNWNTDAENRTNVQLTHLSLFSLLTSLAGFQVFPSSNAPKWVGFSRLSMENRLLLEIK